MSRTRETIVLKEGDQVVHQSHPGRFAVIGIQKRQHLNEYSDAIVIRSVEGVELTVLESSVRKVAGTPLGAVADEEE